ncbi:hypothetical protein AOL_s00076g635 [Orbilia oligospora ATCC 24927]|uniref:Prefoldin subunit 1 n=1 Tax=Arthrobotrys oligospora (strain ATCC 24927 / CBS 115.81 / DSM 1491) TaxID=756982 RepID=G1XAH7_ARTOA|nr:hypothetical protein AOL_s00076g635 [Orbilia oligospora ATCC 24927]EGX49837.1 hypothetical protein AOL_s00076g635 [Orbilia oligospora ATCC 24927]
MSTKQQLQLSRVNIFIHFKAQGTIQDVDIKPGFAEGRYLQISPNGNQFTDEYLQVLQEIETQAILSQQQLTVVKSQITSKQRDTRMIQLTESELSSLPASTKVYEGVGKMFIQEDTSKVKKRLETERNTLEEDIKGLKKRQTYLETTYSNASDHMNKILNRSG